MSVSQPLRASDIIFPALSTNFSQTLSSLTRSALSISNRLDSISKDAAFVSSVANAYDLPLIANERCGSWYINPHRKAESAYFKSTDGHTGEWAFSLRRLNTQVLGVIGEHDGCVIVDSTRRGKSMPDALSKTVPIWCCVLNRMLFPEYEVHSLHTPPQSVSASEHSQIEARLDGFVHQLQELNIPVASLRGQISKPLRPLWITQDSPLPSTPPSFPDFHPVVLCTSSRRVRGGEVSEGGYIQGAGDDSEAWACGLTPPLFWQHREELLRTQEDDLPALISGLLQGPNKSSKAEPILIKPTSTLYVGSMETKEIFGVDSLISCGEGLIDELQTKLKQNYLHLKCRTGKVGSRDLRNELPKLEHFFNTLQEPPKKLLVCCSTGKDLALGVALAILCLYANDNGIISTNCTIDDIDKSFIRQRLSWITTSYPTANPARATLQSINSFLIRPTRSVPITNNPQTNAGPDISSLHIHPESTATLQLFTSLQGHWSIQRTLTSALPTHPSGTFSGTANFQARDPSSLEFLKEYLYEEQGIFLTSTGFNMTAKKKYAYRYCEEKDEISVWFVDENGKDKYPPVTGMFVEVALDQKESGKGSGRHGDGKVQICDGKEKHLCGEDLYAASYKFGADMLATEDTNGGQKGNEKWWEVCYDVKGPRKDYVSQTRYER